MCDGGCLCHDMRNSAHNGHVPVLLEENSQQLGSLLMDRIAQLTDAVRLLSDRATFSDYIGENFVADAKVYTKNYPFVPHYYHFQNLSAVPFNVILGDGTIFTIAANTNYPFLPMGNHERITVQSLQADTTSKPGAQVLQVFAYPTRMLPPSGGAVSGSGFFNGNFVVANGGITAQAGTFNSFAPTLNLNGNAGKWQLGLDTANSNGGDFFLARVLTNGNVQDIIYLNYNNGVVGDPVSIGIGVTPPVAGTYRLQIAADATVHSFGAVQIIGQAGQTGQMLNISDSTPNTRLGIDSAYTFIGEASNIAYEGAIPFRAAGFTDGVFNRCLSLFTNTLSAAYGFGFFATTCYFRTWTNNTTIIQFNPDGTMIFPNLLTLAGGATLYATNSALTDHSAANTATLTNAPVAGNPTKWVIVNDDGVTRYQPLW